MLPLAFRSRTAPFTKENVMRKVNDFSYEVSPGENIAIEITPTNFGGSAPDVEAVLDGNDLHNSGTNDAPIYKFSASKPVGQTHRVLMEFIFFDDAPNNAFYQVSISGQNDVGCPCGFTISKADQVKEAGIRFRVRAA
jgi:hypothetical protein